MTCDHCVASVTEEISELDGVTAVAVDLPTGAVTVTSTAPLAEADVRNAVRRPATAWRRSREDHEHDHEALRLRCGRSPCSSRGAGRPEPLSVPWSRPRSRCSRTLTAAPSRSTPEPAGGSAAEPADGTEPRRPTSPEAWRPARTATPLVPAGAPDGAFSFTCHRAGRHARHGLRRRAREAHAPGGRCAATPRATSTCTPGWRRTARGPCRWSSPRRVLARVRRLPPDRRGPPPCWARTWPCRARSSPVAHAPSRTAQVDGYTVELTGDLVPGRSVAGDAHGEPRRRPGHRPAALPRRARPPGRAARGRPRLPARPPRGRRGPGVQFVAEVPSAGTYRLFLDFRHGDVVRTAEFTVPTAGADAPAPPAPTRRRPRPLIAERTR
jgi:copper chaperone CopZ